MNFAYPLILATPLLFLIGFFLRKPQNRAVLHPQTALLKAISPSWRARLRKPILTLLSILAVVALAIAAARPQRQDEIAKPTESRNLMLTLDLSGSMETPDFPTAFGRTSRAEAVKTVVSEFVKSRKEDRIGLVVFGTTAYLQSPLTLDHELIVSMVERLQVGMAGQDTAIGDGLGLSLKRIQDIPGSSKAIILLTDGVNRAGKVNPLKAAIIAKDLGVKVHTVGIGSTEPAGQHSRGFLFSPQQEAEFDEKTLKQIADITGGIYFNASSIEGLKKVYQEIDKLEKTNADDPSQKIVDELFPKAALIALLSYLLLVILGRSLFLKVPA